MNKFLISIATVVTVGALILVGCPEDSASPKDSAGPTTYPYVCENGTAATGTAAAENTSNCTACDSTNYEIMGTAGTEGSTCALITYQYICENGTAATGPAPTENVSNCARCDLGYLSEGTLGTDGSTCAAISGCTAARSGNNPVSAVYADGDYGACSTLTLASTGFGVASSDSMATFAEIDGGADSTTKAYTLNNSTAAATFAVGFITLGADLDVSGKALRFNVKSPVTGGTTSVRVYLEAVPPMGTSASPTAQTENTEGIVTFTNDGNWKEVLIDFDSTYAFGQTNITSSTVRVIGFALTDMNDDTSMNPPVPVAGIGAQTLDIDEVRIEEVAPNCTAPVSGNASVGLISGDAAYSSCDAISAGFYGIVEVPRSTSSRTISPFTIALNASGSGVSSSPLYTTMRLGGGSSIYAYAIADLTENYDATGKALKFSIRSPATGGTNSIVAILENSTGSSLSTGIETFINDGTWQEISLITSGGILRNNIQRVIFILQDTNGLSKDGIGVQTFDIDEIRFE